MSEVVKTSLRDPHNQRHPFILDADGGSECAACGKYGHVKMHRRPYEMSRKETEATCEQKVPPSFGSKDEIMAYLRSVYNNVDEYDYEIFTQEIGKREKRLEWTVMVWKKGKTHDSPADNLVACWRMAYAA